MKHKETTYLSKLNEAGNKQQQFRKILMSIYWDWYCSAINAILILLNSKMKCTKLN